jgi:hypothetical protein
LAPLLDPTGFKSTETISIPEHAGSTRQVSIRTREIGIVFRHGTPENTVAAVQHVAEIVISCG